MTFASLHAYLPSSTNVREVSQVLQWLVHRPAILAPLLPEQARPRPDFQAPPGPLNPWVINFPDPFTLSLLSNPEMSIFGTLRFTLGDTPYVIHYYPEPSNAGGRELVIFPNDPVSRAFSFHLVDFFGGGVTATDSSGPFPEMEIELHSCSAPHLLVDPSLAPELGDLNARFYCFYGSLARFPRLDASALRVCESEIDRCQNWEYGNSFFQARRAFEDRQTLEATLPLARDGSTTLVEHATTAGRI